MPSFRPNRSARSTLLADRAHAFRLYPTNSEQLLWQALRRRALGVEFRRQVVIGSFIVDFVAPATKLIVEIDGPYHQRRRSADARRDRKLARLGYRVLRLPADQVVAPPLSGNPHPRRAGVSTAHPFRPF